METKALNGEDALKKTDRIVRLKDLLVFDLLEVTLTSLDPSRLVARYEITRNKLSESIDLIYRFETPVFNPDEGASMNLASMMAAQVAINYGLFCKTIRFIGWFEKQDRHFIRTMMENTAREITVKKFLEPNVFLIDGGQNLVVEKVKKFTNARVQFKSHPRQPKNLSWELWPVREVHHAVLSSGGKDSLLSYGLLDEICSKREKNHRGRTHSIFINESGKHWFTALNAYRHFSEHIPDTHRVWVNSDRVFSWMLRRMPFIRKDFSDVRSDKYPIRLWTVAVFLFGALPLMRKHGIGRLIIGDEFDTTVRSTHRGVTHYDGLYDQSLFFDQAMSRYFLQKGWAIRQFSLLRPMSEMLIQKTLAFRYPHLLKHQVSCHAAHKKEDRVRPCGRCEKCRRIVGMLLAINADPKNLGYDDSKIDKCLTDLTQKGVHQESEGAAHLFFMLGQNLSVKAFKKEFADKLMGKEHPEVLKLRFDKYHSPFNAVPLDLRRALFLILLQYADGAAMRMGKKWKETDILSDERFLEPYPHDFSSVSTAGHRLNIQETDVIGGFRWGELTWPEAEERFKEVDVALLPVGAIEQHGPHLPLDTDAFDAKYLATAVAEASSDPKPLVLPLIPYGVSYHHQDFKGTVSIGNDTLSRLVYDIGMSISENGIKKLVIINGHGGNDPALNYAAQLINRDAKMFVCVDTGETSDSDIATLIQTPNDVHAGEIETSTTLAVRPHMVRTSLQKASIPKFSSNYLDFTSKRGVSWYAYTQKISSSGVMGDPNMASEAKGRKIWEIMIAHLVGLVEDLKRMTLKEIHQRRY